MVKALDLSSNGRVVRVGSNPTPGIFFFFSLFVISLCLHNSNQPSEVGEINSLIALLPFMG